MGRIYAVAALALLGLGLFFKNHVIGVIDFYLLRYQGLPRNVRRPRRHEK